MSAILLSAFRRPVRVMLGDWRPGVQKYANSSLDDAARTVIQLGKMNHTALMPSTQYVLNPAEDGLLPDFPDTVVGVNLFALMSYHMLKLFVAPSRDRYSYHTRVLSESFGSANKFLAVIEAELHKLEHGAMFEGYQNYYSWLSGTSGLPLAEILAEFSVSAPLWGVALTRDGMRIA